MSTPNRLQDTALYQHLKQQAQNDEEVVELLTKTGQIFKNATEILKAVIARLPQFTLHDDIHIIAVVDLMGRILGTDGIKRLNPLECAACIMAAALHDIGLSPPESEVQLLKKCIDNPININDQQKSYIKFRSENPEVLRRRAELELTGSSVEIQQIDDFLLSAFIRTTHGIRTERMIRLQFDTLCVYAGRSFVNTLAKVCRSHTEDPQWLDQISVNELIGSGGKRCNWRFIAILLRLADVLDFDSKRTPAVLFTHLGIRDHVSIAEWNKHQAIRGWDIRPNHIAFSAKCSDPVIEHTLREFLSVIGQELKTARRSMLNMHIPTASSDQYQLILPADIDDSQVGPETDSDGEPLYHYKSLRFRFDHNAVMQILMGLSLYGDRTLFLRELIQNAVDTCCHRAAVEKSHYIPKITVRLLEYGSSWILEVQDNGMGMTMPILEKYFAQIGQSLYRSADFQTDVGSNSFRPVSKFGIGVLSTFMVSNRLNVETLSARSHTDTPWNIEVANEGALFWIKRGEKADAGTTVRLYLTEKIDDILPITLSGRKVIRKNKNTTEFSSFDRLRDTVRHIAPRPSISIEVKTESEQLMLPPKWEPDFLGDFGDDLRILQESIDLNEISEEGLKGWIRFYILVDENNEPVVEAAGLGTTRTNGEMVVLPQSTHGDYYVMHADGIRRYTIRRDVKGGSSTQGLSIFRNRGTFSQQGFRVTADLLRVGQAKMILPLPISYDIDLSGPLCVPLTADRNRIVDCKNTVQVLNELSEKFSHAIYSRILETGIVSLYSDTFDKLASTEALCRSLLAVRSSA